MSTVISTVKKTIHIPYINNCTFSKAGSETLLILHISRIDMYTYFICTCREYFSDKSYIKNVKYVEYLWYTQNWTKLKYDIKFSKNKSKIAKSLVVQP